MPVPHSLRQVTPGLLVIAFALLACSDSAVGPSGGQTFRSISAGYLHTCALDAGGSAFCWGNNDVGTLGDGTRISRSVPTRVAANAPLSELDAGAAHNCGLTASGTAFCWGHNDEGQLGDATFADRDVPTQVSGALTFAHISAGHAHSCGVTTSGMAYCWGDDSRGQLGNDVEGPARTNTPVRVQFGGTFYRVYAGYYQSCGLTNQGEAFCWGGGESGQNGDSTQATRHVPARVATTRRFQSLAPGDRFVCGISNGEVWCWGANRDGELGRPADSGSAFPVRIGNIANATAVYTSMGTSTIGSSADPYACALLADRSVLCWGGAVPPLRSASVLPAEIKTGLQAQDVAVGALHVCVIDDARHTLCGGANGSGQVGDGTNTNRAALTPVTEP